MFVIVYDVICYHVLMRVDKCQFLGLKISVRNNAVCVVHVLGIITSTNARTVSLAAQTAKLTMHLCYSAEMQGYNPP